MAVYNPLIISPTSGEAIDATNINRLEWDYKKDSTDTTVQSSYKVDIYNFANTLIHTSGSVGSSNEYYDLPATTLTNGNEYKWVVTVNVSKVSRKAVFKTQDTPVATVDTLPFPFIYQFYKFTGTVTQAQGVGVKSFKWFLYDASDVLITDSGDDEIIGSTVEYEFTGLDNATTYKVDYSVTIQSGLTTTSNRLTFTTAYTAPVDPDAVLTFSRPDIGMNTIDWTAVVTQTGNVYDSTGTIVTPTYVTGKWGFGLSLAEGECLIYDLNAPIPFKFGEDMWIELPVGFDGNFIELYNNGELIYQVGYTQTTGGFYYDRKGRRVNSIPISIPVGHMKIIIQPRYIGYEISSTQYILR